MDEFTADRYELKYNYALLKTRLCNQMKSEMGTPFVFKVATETGEGKYLTAIIRWDLHRFTAEAGKRLSTHAWDFEAADFALAYLKEAVWK